MPPTAGSAGEWIERGKACSRSGDHEQALACYVRAVEAAPVSAEAYLFLCNELKELGRYNEAIECYNKALKIDPASCQLWINKGNTLVKLRREDEAMECFDRARRTRKR